MFNELFLTKIMPYSR